MQTQAEARAAPHGAIRADRSTSVRWRIFGVVFLITLVNLVDRISLSIAMPTIAKEFALSPTMQGLILSSFFWSYALLQIPGGWLIDRYGPRRVIAGATILWGVFQTLLGAATGGLSMLLMRVGLGGAEAPLFPAGSKLNALWLSRHERARGAVLMDAGSPLGAAIGGLAISNLILVFGSWRMAFIAAGLVTIACGWLAWRYLRDDPAKHPGVNAAELDHIRDGAPPLANAASAADNEPAFPKRSAVAMCIGRMSWAMIFFGLLTWGPSYLTQARGLSLQQIGTSTFFIFLSGALGSLAGGFLCDALCASGMSRGKVVKGMVTVSGLTTLAVFWLLPSITSAVVAVAVLCAAAFFLMWGSLYWSLPSLLASPRRVGLLGALMNCFGSIGGISIPLITGFILQRTGSFDAVLQFYSACALVYIFGSIAIDLRRTH
ncbi:MULTISPECIES: MFS transporter [unclassified Caballeronia]|uniref:MFS transporter n=1 Tax=unclassified Caballeronia TaxID=2646786 RepID=UPI00285AFADC|nr:MULTISPECIES: MFS transporter [unclassified Caballeronia]MDR5752936.1 MFS transporter [Caballeronia sp. LZ024]MDR5841223.1 MFS transporter [Caballeronia sp. LZ031]